MSDVSLDGKVEYDRIKNLVLRLNEFKMMNGDVVYENNGCKIVIRYINTPNEMIYMIKY